MPKISQYPTITTLVGNELILMDSGPAGNRTTVTVTTGTLAQAIAGAGIEILGIPTGAYFNTGVILCSPICTPPCKINLFFNNTTAAPAAGTAMWICTGAGSAGGWTGITIP